MHDAGLQWEWKEFGPAALSTTGNQCEYKNRTLHVHENLLKLCKVTKFILMKCKKMHPNKVCLVYSILEFVAFLLVLQTVVYYI